MNTIKIEDKVSVFGCKVINGKVFVIPPFCQPEHFEGEKQLWLIGEDESALIKTDSYTVNGAEITLGDYTKKVYDGLPDCDFMGNGFELTINGDSKYQNAVSQFYWKNLVNECAEISAMKKSKVWDKGYVLSTLMVSTYAGTYPAVDHEFHIRGRMALGDKFDLDVIERMILLQIKTMKKDYTKQYRIPCSVQPSGKREYYITRKTMDETVKARMFPLTGIIELCEELYNYYCLTKNIDFVRKCIPDIEKGLKYAERRIDKNGALWAEVYYEDQVMKNGRTAQAQAFAINSFNLFSRLESLCGNNAKAEHYKALSDKMKANYVQSIPAGYWDDKNSRYVDWIDKNSNVHDHIHLLANALSVTYGFNNDKRNEMIKALISSNDDIFQKFPSFVSAEIEDYTNSEIGDGGPYDLCAAGRYWCHDAKYRIAVKDYDLVKNQIDSVYEQALTDGFYMGERYDMNYVYYIDDKNWHGASKYYEYPNVFIDVLIHDLFGVSYDEKADLKINPTIDNLHFKMESYGIEFDTADGVINVKNISGEHKTVKICSAEIIDLSPDSAATFAYK